MAKKEKPNRKSANLEREKTEKKKKFFVKPKEVAKKDESEIKLHSQWKDRLSFCKLRFSKKNIPILIGFLVVLGLLGTSGYFYHQYKKATAGDAAKNG